MAEVGKLSPSKIALYLGCRMAYYLKYIMHEKVASNVRLVFGKAMHYLVDRFYDVNYKSAESFVKYSNYYWAGDIAGDFLEGKAKRELIVREIPYIGKNPETGKKEEHILRVGNHVDLGPEPVGVFFGYMKIAKEILTKFYLRHKNLPLPFVRENAFGVKNDEPVYINGHLVRGVFDRIDRIDKDYYGPNLKLEKGYYITDYKTDKNFPTDSFVLHRNLQFTLYSCAFREKFREIERAILYYHLRSGKRLETHRSEKDHDYLKRILDEVANGVTKDIFIPFYDFHCNFCDYKSACEKYSLPYHGGPRIDLEGRIKPVKEFIDWEAEDVPDWINLQEDER